MVDQHTAGGNRDLSQRPVSFMIGWGIPILAIVSTNFVRGVLSFEGVILILAGAFAWMGIGCLINAQRCKRRHCYLSGPVFLAGAAGVLLVGFEAVDFGRYGLVYVTWGTFLLVALTFIPEAIWGRYRGAPYDSGNMGDGRTPMPDTQELKDYSRRPLPFMIAWGLPILLLVSVNVLEEFLPAAPIILIIAGSYAWMGVGCVINALRCGRLHCYISGPALLIGGTLILLVGFSVLDLGSITVMHISYATIVVVALSFVPELLAGSYGQKYRNTEKG